MLEKSWRYKYKVATQINSSVTNMINGNARIGETQIKSSPTDFINGMVW